MRIEIMDRKHRAEHPRCVQKCMQCMTLGLRMCMQCLIGREGGVSSADG